MNLKSELEEILDTNETEAWQIKQILSLFKQYIEERTQRSSFHYYVNGQKALEEYKDSLLKDL